MIVFNDKLRALLDEAPLIEVRPGHLKREMIVASVEFGPIKIIEAQSSCYLCRQSYQHYMVHDEVRAEANLGEGYVCPRCLQGRLGRKLTLNDFNDARINDLILLLRENQN